MVTLVTTDFKCKGSPIAILRRSILQEYKHYTYNWSHNTHNKTGGAVSSNSASALQSNPPLILCHCWQAKSTRTILRILTLITPIWRALKCQFCILTCSSTYISLSLLKHSFGPYSILSISGPFSLLSHYLRRTYIGPWAVVRYKKL